VGPPIIAFTVEIFADQFFFLKNRVGPPIITFTVGGHALKLSHTKTYDVWDVFSVILFRPGVSLNSCESILSNEWRTVARYNHTFSAFIVSFAAFIVSFAAFDASFTAFTIVILGAG
jgi:hypothetical protein